MRQLILKVIWCNIISNANLVHLLKGLVTDIKTCSYLKIHNRIYELIFNNSWIEQHL